MKLTRGKGFIIILSALFFFICLSTVSNAKSISYKALLYGTNKTSMASGYFVKPATVRISHHKYVVTMQIKTAKSLSSFPVVVNWVNGEEPKNVRKAKDRAGNSHYYYSFTTTNLTKRINAKLAIDVPKVYKAHHLISFKFSTAGLPKLSQQGLTDTHKVKASYKHTTTTAPSKSAVVRPASKRTQIKKSKVTSSPKINKAKATQPKKLNHVTKHKQQPNKKGKQQVKPQKRPTQMAAAKKSDKSPKAKTNHDKNHTPLVIGGVIAVIAAVGGGSWLVYKH
ncbi:MAG: NEAT domain-containing protein [Lentilactobacillus hilgardii]